MRSELCRSLRYRISTIAIYLTHTAIKGTASLKLHRNLGVTYTRAWHLSYRIRECSSNKQDAEQLSGPVELDETFVGGKRANMSNAKLKQVAGTGPGGLGSGKTAVVGMKDHGSNQFRAKSSSAPTMQHREGIIGKHADADAAVYTDDSGACKSLPCRHSAVKHSVSGYVRGQAHTNGIESF